nr:MAG TPA: hypothetical protein [Bacteriophage sp.]
MKKIKLLTLLNLKYLPHYLLVMLMLGLRGQLNRHIQLQK